MKAAIIAALCVLVLVSEAQASKQRTQLAATNDWMTAVRVVQAAYPGSAWWLASCSGSEGGHGWWRWRNPNGYLRYSHGQPVYVGDIPGGPMQYFEGTWRGDFNAALADLRSRGFAVPPSARSWYSPLGQAIAAGWAYWHDRPAGKWTGGGC